MSTGQEPPPRIRFTWSIHWDCNLRCSYCWCMKQWQDYSARCRPRAAAEWLEAWSLVHQKHGRAYLAITGGEPFTYPGFEKMILELSRIHWPISITTNASCGVEELAQAADPRKFFLSLTFHPEHQDLDDFVARAHRLRAAGFRGENNLVVYPPFFPDLPGIISRFTSAGENLCLIPFVGEHKGVRYPEGYLPEQRRSIGLSESWLDQRRRQGLPCPAGQLSALVFPDGQVLRCGRIGERSPLGSLFDQDFRLQPHALPCDEEYCACEEWKVIPGEIPPEKPSAWLR